MASYDFLFDQGTDTSYLGDLSQSESPTGLLGSMGGQDLGVSGLFNAAPDNLDFTLGELSTGGLTQGSSGPSIMDAWSSPSAALPTEWDWLSEKSATPSSPFSLDFSPVEMDTAEDTSMFAPVKEAAASVDAFLRGIIGNEHMGKFYGSAILFGAQAILSHLNGSNTNSNAIALQQAKFDQEDKVRKENNTREDEKRARQGVPAQQGMVAPNVNATRLFKAPGYATNQSYQNMDTGRTYGLLGG